MGTVTITYDWYNRRNPKCRCCKHWKTEDEFSGECVCKEAKVKDRDRYHNSKACSRFRFKGYGLDEPREGE